MKKLLAVLLAMLLVCSSCLMVSAAALDVENPDDLFNDEELDWGDKMGKFIVGDAEAVIGKEFTVPVSVENNPGIISLKLVVSYDTNVLELVSAAAGDFGSVDGEVPSLSFGPVETAPFVINWINALEKNNEKNGVVANLTFRVKDSAAAGTTVISVGYDPEDVFDYNLENVEFTTTDGTVTVAEASSHIPGDVNDDGRVNIRDLTALQQYINKWGNTINEDAGDVTGDGRINIRDLTLLQQYINKWPVELK